MFILHPHMVQVVFDEIALDAYHNALVLEGKLVEMQMLKMKGADMQIAHLVNVFPELMVITNHPYWWSEYMDTLRYEMWVRGVQVGGTVPNKRGSNYIWDQQVLKQLCTKESARMYMDLFMATKHPALNLMQKDQMRRMMDRYYV